MGVGRCVRLTRRAQRDLGREGKKGECGSVALGLGGVQRVVGLCVVGGLRKER